MYINLKMIVLSHMFMIVYFKQVKIKTFLNPIDFSIIMLYNIIVRKEN